MDTLTPAEEASKEAVHKTKGAQQAVEAAREAQNLELADLINSGVADTLQKIFGDGDDTGNPAQMRVLWKRIPLLCKRVDDMHDKLEKADTKLDYVSNNVSSINDNLRWAIRIVLVGVISAVLKLVLIH